MDPTVTELERTFQFARAGLCGSIQDIERRLRAEGYSGEQVTGKLLRKQLLAQMQRHPHESGCAWKGTKMIRIVIALAVATLTVCAAAAQAPSHPPTAPPTLPSMSPPKEGKDLVVNPTDAECKSGWNANLKWTKEQFDQLCATMRAAK